ncbi:hypothetical protein [Pedobacter africanus]|uniref:hypothetical protein n=1 Tax=Pedobacter africanus TaxID=151894 RepID=UPI0009FF1A0C|nr:hypothetical protein [Pedobacter africanus]
MKADANILYSKLRQTFLVLFASLFLFIAIVPVFHHHGQNPVCRHLSCDDTEKIQLTDKCAVCDYFHHVQAQPVLLPGTLSLPIIHPEVINLDAWVPCGNYSFVLSGFSTRGPPMLIS